MSDSCPCDLTYDPNVHVPRSELEEMRAQRLVWQDKLLAALELGVAPHLSVGLTVVERTTAELREELAQVRAQLESIEARLIEEVAEYVAGESILAYQAVALVAGVVYAYDAGNVAHMFAFIGFSLGADGTGSLVRVQTGGVVEFPGWSLAEGEHYLAGRSGGLVSDTGSALIVFSRVIAHALGATRLRIITESNPIKLCQN